MGVVKERMTKRAGERRRPADQKGRAGEIKIRKGSAFTLRLGIDVVCVGRGAGRHGNENKIASSPKIPHIDSVVVSSCAWLCVILYHPYACPDYIYIEPNPALRNQSGVAWPPQHFSTHTYTLTLTQPKSKLTLQIVFPSCPSTSTKLKLPHKKNTHT